MDIYFATRFKVLNSPTARKADRGLGIVRRQIDRGTGPCEAFDRVQRSSRNVVIRADAVYPTGEHQSFVIRGIASQKEGRAVLLNDDGEVIRRVTGRGDHDNIPSFGQSLAGSEGAKRLRREVEWC